MPHSPTPTPFDPLVSLTLVLPFDIDATYNPVSMTQGGISYKGDWVIKPYGGKIRGRFDDSWLIGSNSDIWFEVVPGTLLRASVAGRVNVQLNPVSGAPGRDWVVSIQIGDGPYSVGYDHMVDILVSAGDFVEAGQYLGNASPAAFRHGGPEGEKLVDEFEWGMRRAWPTRADSFCAYDFLSEADQSILLNVVENMGDLGFHTGDKICLVHEMTG